MSAGPLHPVARLGREGDGLVELADGSVVAVPAAAPGDGVAFDEGGAPRIVQSSPLRRDPPCPYADRCGGCRLQHVADDYLADWRVARIVDALRHRGVEAKAFLRKSGEPDFPESATGAGGSSLGLHETRVGFREDRPSVVAPPVVAPERSRRRVGFVAGRTKKSVLLGFHRARSHEIVDIDDCLIARPEIMAAAPALRRLTALAAPRKRAISLHATTSMDGLDLVVDGAKALDLALGAAVTDWVEAAEAEGVSIARVSWNGEVALMRRPPRQRFGRALVAPPPGGFLQATAEGEAALVAAVREGVGDASRVADLFSGCGTFAAPLAEKAEVLAVDADAAAIDALDRGWRMADGLKRVVPVARDLFRRPLLAAELAPFDAVVFDPPRVGAAAQTEMIAASGLTRVVGVSCNPDSFARDAATLVAAGFRLVKVTPVDQFRWSPHLELVGVFER